MRRPRIDSQAQDRVRSRVDGTGLHIGISGWRYPGWRGEFYPKNLPQRCELEFAASKFNSIEINGSFYSLQLPSSYRRWYSETPDHFVFAIKGSRFISHMKKLRDAKIPLANFFASGLLGLGEKLGPILWQLPPNLGWDQKRLRGFFDLLPRDTSEAAELARKHDTKLKARAWTQIDICRPLRYAIEVRHSTFITLDFFDLLRQHNVAFVIADTAKKWPYAEVLTADFIYVRLHGDEQLYTSGYSDRALDWWAKRIKRWRRAKNSADRKFAVPARSDRKKRDAFVYFDNDAKVHAPFDAMRLLGRFRRRNRPVAVAS